ncbi:hypothetical protein ACFLY3_00595 [Chloroflexota bacterium]
MIDSEERRYRKLKRLGQELHVPIPETFLKLEVRDKDGRVIKRQSQRCHSFGRNVYNYIFSHLVARNCPDVDFGAGHMSMRATSGTIRHANYGAGIIAQMNFEGNGPNAGAGVDDRGILVGSGTNPESFEGYFLQTQIDNGTGAGQLSHVASETPVYSYDAGTKTWTAELKRYFNNNSGGSIGVNELALVYYLERVVGTADKVLWSRDRLSSTVTIPNTGQLRVTYTIRLAYPA